MRLFAPRIRLAALGATVAVVCGCLAAPQERIGGTRTAVPDASAPATSSSPATRAAAVASSAEPPDFSDSIARQSAGVVSVTAIRPSPDGELDTGDEEARIELFHELNPGSPPVLLPRTATRLEGCGFIITGDGYIVTNAHVVGGASIVKVALSTGREFPARLVGVDLPTDIAVLKVEAENLPVVTLGDSRHLRVGQWVAAIGAPFGFEQSAAVGVVSALDRTLPGDTAYVSFIQTDLPLNPGNSGGPLLDISGNVVGVNAEVALRDGAITGISFAVPVDLAHNVAEQLIRTGHIDRPELGVGFQDVDAQLSRAFGLAEATGVLVNSVVPGGPAQVAGLSAGDVVVAVNGQRIASARQFIAAIASLTPGSAATLTIWRTGQRSDVVVRTAHSPAAPPRVLPVSAPARSSSSALLAVHPLTTKARRVLGTEGYLLVMGVSERAAAAGIEVGDIILAVNARPVRTDSELTQALVGDGSTVALLIDRSGERLFIGLPLADTVRERSADAGVTRRY